MVTATVLSVIEPAQVIRADGSLRVLHPGDDLLENDIISTLQGGQIVTQLADGSVVVLMELTRLLIAPLAEGDSANHAALRLHVFEGNLAITEAGDVGSEVSSVILASPAGDLDVINSRFLLSSNAGGLTFTLLANADQAVGLLRFENQAGVFHFAAANHLVRVLNRASVPEDLGILSAGDMLDAFPELAEIASSIGSNHDAHDAVNERHDDHDDTALSHLTLSGEGLDVSPGGDINAAGGDAIDVTANIQAFDLTPSPAALQFPSELTLPARVLPKTSDHHTEEALFLNQPGPSSEVSLPERQIFSAFDPGRRWEAIGRADEFAGSIPELPREATRLITSRQGDMALIEASDVSTHQIETFLHLNPGTISGLVADTTPNTGAALLALNAITLAAGQSILMDVFFDAAGALPLNDFAVMSIATGNQSLAVPIIATADVGSFDGSGWHTIEYTAGTRGAYTFGFAVLNDGPDIGFSRLYVDNIRPAETSSFPFQQLDMRSDSLGGTYRLLAPAPITTDDTFEISEDDVLVGQGGDDGLIANDLDPDPFDALNFLGIDRSGTKGRVNFSGDGSFTYDPTARFNGLSDGETAQDQFSYLVDGGNGQTATGTVSITIQGANDAPTANPDVVTADRSATSLEIQVTANDTDPDSDDDATTLKIVSATAQSGAMVEYDGTPGGGITYYPQQLDPNSQSSAIPHTDTIVYTVEDRHGAQSTSEVTILLEYRQPLAVEDFISLDEDGSTTVDVTSNDIPGTASNAVHVASVNSVSTIGKVSLNSENAVVYDSSGQFEGLAEGESASDLFTYTLSNDSGDISTARVSVTINGVNDAPVVTMDAVSVDENITSVDIPVLLNDSDPDSDDNASTLRVIAASAASGADVVFTGEPGAGLTYALNPQGGPLGPGETAQDHITYTIEDRHGTQATGTVDIEIIGVNDPVTAIDDAIDASEDNPIVLEAPGLLANDVDPDGFASLKVVAVNGQPVTDSVVIPVLGGVNLRIAADGAVGVDQGPQLNTLAAGETVTDTFRYTVSDGFVTDDATVTVTFAGANDAPQANGDTAVMSASETDVVIPVLANDGDVDNDDSSATLRIVAAASQSGAAVAFSGHPGDGITYDPSGRFAALGAGETATDEITYTIVDRHGATASAIVSVEISGENDAPVASDDRFNIDARSILSQPALLGLLANDVDVDNSDSLRVTAVNGNSANVGASMSLASGALVTVREDGSLTYDPNGAFDSLTIFETGQDTFTYTVADKSGATDSATAAIHIFVSNLPPNAGDDLISTDANSAIRIPVLANDFDPEQALLRVAEITTDETAGQVKIGADGTITYDPNGQFDFLSPGETAIDTFRYVVDDNLGGRDEAFVAVTIHGAAASSTDPGVLAQSFETPAGLFVAGWQREPGQGSAASPVSLVSSAAIGDLSFLPTHLQTMARLDAAGSTAVGPGDRQSAIEAFLDVSGGALPDDDGRHSGQAGDGSEPNAGSAVRTVVTFSSSDVGPDGRLFLSFDWNFLSAASVPDSGVGANDYAVFTISGGTTKRVEILSDARETGQGASGWRTSLYEITDDFALLPNLPVQLTVGFAIINDASSANPSTLLIDNVRLNREIGESYQNISSSDDGTFETFVQKPLAVADAVSAAATTNEDTPLTLASDVFLANDAASLGASESSLRIVAVDDALGQGSVSLIADGVRYDPRGAFDRLTLGDVATDTITYSITDANGGIATAQAAILIHGRNDAPVAFADAISVSEDDQAVLIAALANDVDPDTDDNAQSLVVTDASAASLARLSFSGRPGDGILYDPGTTFTSLREGESFTDTITYTIADRHGESGNGSITVTVTGRNDAPVAVVDEATVAQNSALIINALANDGDPDSNDPRTIVGINGSPLAIGVPLALASGATITLAADGTLHYDQHLAFARLREGEHAVESFQYRIADAHGASDDASVNVTVLGLNDAPVPGLDLLQTTAEDSVSVTTAELLANDRDPDTGDTYHIGDILTHDTLGTVIFDGETIVYDPNGRFIELGATETAVDTFSYTLIDEAGAASTGTAQVTITGLNDSPLAADDNAHTDESKALSIDVLANDHDPDATDQPALTALDTSSTLGNVSINPDGTVLYDPAGAFDGLAPGETAVDQFSYTITDGGGLTDTGQVTVSINGRPNLERLVESFEGSFDVMNRTSSFARIVSEYQETDGDQTLYVPTDPATASASMMRLEARGSTIATVESFLGIPRGALPRDSDGSNPAFGSAVRIIADVERGDRVSFDWMFDARDFVDRPPDGNEDNDYAVVAISDGTTTQLFRLSDIREVGDQSASGWRTSQFEAASSGELTIGIGVINDRSPIPVEENSFLLVDNVRMNREFDDSYQVVNSQADGTFETLSQNLT
ncbi:MAG: tandem-95 repeat protein [Hyphomicrobiales bacterium]|nr:tandem-95 repeat protein [Hyphomicrobiales bacterium]